MSKSVIDLRQFMKLQRGEEYYKGYFIPAHPGWLRVMVSKVRTDGLVEARGFRVFLDSGGHVLWKKPGFSRVQDVSTFERDLAEFRQIIEGAGLLFFVQDYNGGGGQ
ncbi:MAG: hypothetical protein P8Y66_04375 [Nitrospirota bacterium]